MVHSDTGGTEATRTKYSRNCNSAAYMSCECVSQFTVRCQTVLTSVLPTYS